MSAPVDPTTTTAWAELDRLRGEFTPDLRAWFDAEPSRVVDLTHDAADLHVDLSKSYLTPDVIAALIRLAEQTRVAERRDAMFAGEKINTTEDRAVLHTALRLPRDASLTVDGQDVVADVHAVLDRMGEFTDALRSGAWRGVTGERIHTVVNIGIGGSDLGPRMVVQALRSGGHANGPRVHFIANMDGHELAELLPRLQADSTVFIIASKTFGTAETMQNAASARACRGGIASRSTSGRVSFKISLQPSRPRKSRSRSSSTSCNWVPMAPSPMRTRRCMAWRNG